MAHPCLLGLELGKRCPVLWSCAISVRVYTLGSVTQGSSRLRKERARVFVLVHDVCVHG